MLRNSVFDVAFVRCNTIIIVVLDEAITTSQTVVSLVTLS